MRLAHIVVRPASPEDDVGQIALGISRHITHSRDTDAIIYVIGSETRAPTAEIKPLIVRLPELPPRLLGSLPKSEQRRERHRIDRLVLKEAIEREIAQRPSAAEHVVVSVISESAGALCQQIADALRLPHVTFHKATDSDNRKPIADLSYFSQYALRAADWIVTEDTSQLLALEKALKLKNATSILGSADQSRTSQARKPAPRASILLFSDIGYSKKAGTQALFNAFDRLRGKGLDVRLTLCGHTDKDERQLWAVEKTAQAHRHGSRLVLEESLPLSDVQRLLVQSHIYCSPCTHDDCQDGRVQALLSGIPIVSCRVGEISALDAQNVSHLSLSKPGDKDDFTRKLDEMVARTLATGVPVDGNFLSTVRARLQERYEKTLWQQALASAFEHHSESMQNARKRVLLFCHDGRGLGHLRRLSRVAEVLQGPFSALLVTGNREASWIVPEEAEYVHLPGRAKILPSKAAYWKRRPFADFSSEAAALAFRQPLITTTAKAFDPDLLILDYLPLGKDWEMYETLSTSRATKYLILRGVLDKPENVRRDILDGEPGRFLDSVFDRILVASDPRIVDVAKEYGLSPRQAEKLTYVGYTVPSTTDAIREKFRKERGVSEDQHWVVCSLGSGMFAEKIAMACINIARSFPDTLFDIVLGPKTSLDCRDVVNDTSRNQNIRVMRENRSLPFCSAASDVLVCHGGYNSIVEAISGGATIVVSPTTDKDDEQYIHPYRLSQFYPIKIAEELSDLHEMVSLALRTHLPQSRNSMSSEISTNGLEAIRNIAFADLGVERAIDVRSRRDVVR